MAEEGFARKRRESWFHEAEKHDPQFVEKRGILAAYAVPSPCTQVICIDEMGLPAVKTYPGEEWVQGEGNVFHQG